MPFNASFNIALNLHIELHIALRAECSIHDDFLTLKNYYPLA